MPKLSLSDITSGYNSTARINAAFAALEAALENTVSRDGSSPNAMGANLDLNSNRILNLGSPQSATDAARWADVTSALSISTPVPAQTGNSGKYLTTDGSSLSWGSPTPLTYYPISSLETANSVTPTDYSYPWGYVLRYGADASGATSSTSAIQAAINSGHDVTFTSGTYKAANLSQSLSSQRFLALGEVKVQKNANGPIITAAGNEVEFQNIGFRGDASSPTFTGDGIVLTGENPRLINCGSRWISGAAVRATKNALLIQGTCDIYQTTGATGSDYDIVVGTSGTATLYHRIIGIKTTQATGGIYFIDTGSGSVTASQFGKLTVAAGTSPAGVNGGNYIGNRILGAVSVNISSSTFSGNTVGAVSVTFAGGTSGHSFDESNVLSVGATITDSSTSSHIVDLRQVPPQSYTPSWTAASVNPSIGNGTITGIASKVGRAVTVQLRVVMGSTTTYGTGIWAFSVPYVPSTTLPAVGTVHAVDSGTTNYVGLCETATDGTARVFVYGDAANAYGASVPFTWANTDVLTLSITYFV